ncbi:MAG: hypothetical protein H0V17_00120, partial [Deltaproteobacteria bacterium]|nr:hypothetical protein [Deltaproteobacteria bacterium]
GPTQYAPTICDGIERGLRDAWGRHRSINGRQIWVNTPAAQRAIYEPGACELRYEKITDIDSWLSKSDDSLVPMWAVGKPAKLLLDRLSERALSTSVPPPSGWSTSVPPPSGVSTEADDQITWSVRGIGAGTGPTQLAADVRNGKVVSVFASVETDPETQSAITERVSELTGKQPNDDLVWKTVPRIAMETGAVQMFLTIGTRPQ